ncbi:uncharacterized protein K444DRAFT_701824 [Hyaloscypha bicolor E]|uniref:DUF6594 domain-containing protein n=1 Tax=Hyaloscypha bicolor E TaxID=1095630 RepID=A0A2J6TT44_9HELO|nr:uncharacterized protein K444DRAFT_701824 [Hyaloscypha bicolor E]PMD66184.1 hypothetical protein K444DRAFT_701824 [Hyaloscypha bicolor E]
MPGEHSIFDSEWWWPKWSDMPSLPLPPSPQQQDQSTLRAFETDLEPGANVLLSSDSGKLGDQDPLLMAYPDRLWSISKIAVGMEAVFETRQPIYYFMLFRHCDLNLIDHKLLHLEARLHATQGTYISNAEKQELGNLLQDQEGIFQLQSFREYRTIPRKDPTSSRLPSALISILRTSLTYTNYEKLQLKFFSGRPPQRTSLPLGIIASTIITIFGRALLIVPMAIMSFNTNRTKSLVTVSRSVVLSGFFLGAIIRSKSSEIFVATATYAAVLVVFVGTGGTGSG